MHKKATDGEIPQSSDIRKSEKRVNIPPPHLNGRLLRPMRALPGLPEGLPGALPHVGFGRHQGDRAQDAVEGGRLPVGAPPRQALPEPLGGEPTLGGKISLFSFGAGEGRGKASRKKGGARRKRRRKGRGISATRGASSTHGVGYFELARPRRSVRSPAYANQKLGEKTLEKVVPFSPHLEWFRFGLNDRSTCEQLVLTSTRTLCRRD